jgi:two-component system sensor histidine kinase KdpD
VYVQTPSESADRIDATVQRKLVDNFQMAQTMGAEVVKLAGSDVARAICKFAVEKGVTLAIVGQSSRSGLSHLFRKSVVEQLMNNRVGLDVLVVGVASARGPGEDAS